MHFRPPTDNVLMSYLEWLETAQARQTQATVLGTHFYLQLVAIAPNTFARIRQSTIRSQLKEMDRGGSDRASPAKELLHQRSAAPLGLRSQIVDRVIKRRDLTAASAAAASLRKHTSTPSATS